MLIRENLDEFAWVLPDEHEWLASPAAGVERVMLDRDGDEVAVATSFVRYAPGSRFDGHAHAKGEEFLVLEGEFGDEHDRYPAVTYVRNPPGTAHVPFSDIGCVIFVKLRQFADDDTHQFAKNVDVHSTPASGWQRELLHQHGGERVELLRAAGGVRVAVPSVPQAREVLILSGAADWQIHKTYRLTPRAWIRLPPGQPLRLNSTEPLIAFTKTRPKLG